MFGHGSVIRQDSLYVLIKNLLRHVKGVVHEGKELPLKHLKLLGLYPSYLGHELHGVAFVLCIFMGQQECCEDHSKT